jgi:hypothetical protein
MGKFWNRPSENLPSTNLPFMPYPETGSFIKRFTVRSAHDQGDWRYVELNGQGAVERATLYLDRSWFEKLHIGTKVEITVTIVPG